MAAIIMTKGLPGSGKTTWAKQYIKDNPATVIVCKDDMRKMLFDGKHSDEREKLVIRLRNLIIETALSDIRDVIVCDTNLAPKHEIALRELAKKNKAAFSIKDFTEVPIKECISNDLKRFDTVGEYVIRQMHTQFLTKPPVLKPFRREAIKAVICDIDGTLALFEGLRSPYDTGKCESDIVNKGLRLILQQLRPDIRVILVSGRSEEFREQTEKWLMSNYVFYDDLFMRGKEDKRPDDIIKEEIYREYIQDCYDIMIVFDDRPRVIRKWKELGLPVADVGNGVEF